MTGDAPYGRPGEGQQPYRRELGDRDDGRGEGTGPDAGGDDPYAPPRGAGLDDERTEVLDPHAVTAAVARSGPDPVLLRAAALCSVGAAAIHAGGAPGDFRTWWAYGAAALLVAAFQTGWALLTWTRRDPRLLAAAVAVDAAAVLLWVVTRTSGLPAGPDRFRPAPLGAADVAATALEVAVVALAVLVLARRDVPARALSRRVAVGTTAAVAVVVLLTSGVALAAPPPGGAGPPGGSGGPAPSGTASGGAGSAAKLPDVAHASDQDRAHATTLLHDSIRATARYRSVSAAKAAGYDVDAAVRRFEARRERKQAKRRLPGETVPALRVPGPRALRTDDHVADPAAPEALVYHRDADGTFTLVGVLYTSRRTTPDVAGPYTRWRRPPCTRGSGAASAAPSATPSNAPSNTPSNAPSTTPSGGDRSCAGGTAGGRGGAVLPVWFVRDTDLTYAYASGPPRPQLLAYQKTLG